jgi:hypothetical protein
VIRAIREFWEADEDGGWPEFVGAAFTLALLVVAGYGWLVVGAAAR